jgi:hypothetical protein
MVKKKRNKRKKKKPKKKRKKKRKRKLKNPPKASVYIKEKSLKPTTMETQKN